MYTNVFEKELYPSFSNVTVSSRRIFFFISSRMRSIFIQRRWSRHHLLLCRPASQPSLALITARITRHPDRRPAKPSKAPLAEDPQRMGDLVLRGREGGT